MSSDESGTEEGVETVYCIKIMTWRREIEKELGIIDRKQMVDRDIFAPQGAKPVKRICGTGNPVSHRGPISKLPHALYNQDWLESQVDDYLKVTLCTSEEQFRWLNILVG